MSSIIGIDIGGSTTKIVGLRDGVIVGATMVRASDPVTSAYGAFGRFLEEAGLKLQEIDRVMCTGVGSSFLKDNIYGIPTVKLLLEQMQAEYAFDYNDGWFQFVAEIPL